MKSLIFYISIFSSIYAQGFFGLFDDSDWKEDLYQNKSKAITLIESKLNGENIGIGSGVNISKSGEVITNYHVVKGADEVWVSFKNGRRHLATHYIVVNERVDFVILHLLGEDNLPFVELGDSDIIKIGQDVVAIGNPLGQWSSMTKGIISQIVDGGGHKRFQTDVTIAPGSSGGALFSSDKKVIGITTSGLGGIDINFAIPSNYVKSARRRASESTKKWIGFDKPKPRQKKVASNTSNSSISNVSASSSEDDIFFNCCASYCTYLILLGLIPW